MQYNDVKESIYKSLNNYTKENTIIIIERCFIDDFNKKIIALISECLEVKAENPSNTINYYYGIYDIYSETSIQQDSQQYNKIDIMIPKAKKLEFKDFNFMENRQNEKKEIAFIEQYLENKVCNSEYIELLKDERNNALDEGTFNIFSYFIHDNVDYDNKEKQENISYIKETVITPVESIKVDLKQNVNDIYAKKEKLNKKENHVILIVIITIIAIILGFLSATYVAGPSNLF